MLILNNVILSKPALTGLRSICHLILPKAQGDIFFQKVLSGAVLEADNKKTFNQEAIKLAFPFYHFLYFGSLSSIISKKER